MILAPGDLLPLPNLTTKELTTEATVTDGTFSETLNHGEDFYLL